MDEWWKSFRKSEMKKWDDLGGFPPLFLERPIYFQAIYNWATKKTLLLSILLDG